MQSRFALPPRTLRLPRARQAGIALALLLVAALALRRAQNPLHGLMLLGFGAVFVLLAAEDLRSRLLPNRLTLPAIAAALVLAGAWPGHGWPSSLAGGAVGFALMLAAFLLLPGFGAGDVKLCGLIGLVCGWPLVLTALTLGVFCNGIAGLALLLSGRAGRRSVMPYGPGLILGALLVLLR
ncbi:MAG TPA: A24 family peptidase [Dehalococcoidia bacterium]|nr:A24 family peptidase [Dehalococcoidia bacterium]